MKSFTTTVAGALIALSLSLVSIVEAKSPEAVAAQREVAAQFSKTKQQLQNSVALFCEANPEYCSSGSRRPQLSCPRMNCRLPRNPEEITGHVECIQNWLSNCP